MILSEEMIRYIENHRQEAYSLLLELARIPAPSNHEERRAEFCLNWLKSQGARGVYIDQALNVVYPADVSQDRPLDVFMAHMDVVFPDESELPLRVEDGRIYCPGVGDDTACLVCLLLAGKYIAEHVDSPPVEGNPQGGCPRTSVGVQCRGRRAGKPEGSAQNL